MDRVAVFVDAGYLFAEGSKLVTGLELPRSELRLEQERALRFLGETANRISGLPLLRIYWYDGSSSGPSPTHLALAYRPNVKLRLGYVNRHGLQKGVDSLIVTDLLNLARNRAMSDAVLLTGDEDIRVGVQQAQEYGVRVHLLGIAPIQDNQSGFLRQEADTIHELLSSDIQDFLSRYKPPEPSNIPTEPSMTAEDENILWEELTKAIADNLTPEEKSIVLLESIRGVIPREIDSQLLKQGTMKIGEQLTGQQKKELRRVFLRYCR